MFYRPYGIRDFVSRAFHQFGSHCATHQIRVILISCVVITSLFYPALAIYWTSKPLSHFSSRWLDAIFTTRGAYISTPTTQFVDDIKDLWMGLDNLVVVDDSWTLAKCAKGATVRLERIVVHRENEPETGSLTEETLMDTLAIQETIGKVLNGYKPDGLLVCVRDTFGECLNLTPLRFLGSDISNTNSTDSVLRAFSSSRRVDVDGMRITPDMTLSRRSVIAHSRSSISYARFLVLTYFFEEDDCSGNVRHNEWLQAIDRLRSSVINLRHGVELPSLVALQYDPLRTSSFPVVRVCLYLAYILFFFYFSGSLRKMDTVHSRWGLAFTGLIEIIASTITSVSVCALVGFRPRMIPWSVLPIVIVFVGAENMFILVDAVVKTPISLPVRERIAIGLSRAGTSNTYKVVTYNSILGTIAGLSSGPIREFCAFATVVLVAHWFLIHTFFVAVLSIDIQRLELSELLSQDPSLQPPAPTTPKRTVHDNNQSTFGFSHVQKALRGRPSRNMSLVMLLAITALLYYIALPPLPTSMSEVPVPPNSTHAIVRDSAAWKVWSTLNPSNFNVLHIRVESPSVITLLPQTTYSRTHSNPHLLRRVTRALTPLWWALKIVLLPITATTGLLYLLLLYLLKNKELLDARQQPENGLKELSSLGVDDNVSFTALPRAAANDFRAVAVTPSSTTAVTVGVDSEIILWRMRDGSFTPRNFTKMCHASSTVKEGRQVSCVAINNGGTLVALGTTNGMLAVWTISAEQSNQPKILFLQESLPPVCELKFLDDTYDSQSTMPILLASSRDGSVRIWTGGSSTSVIAPVNITLAYSASFISSLGDSETWITILDDSGGMELLRYVEKSWRSFARLQGGSPHDPIVNVGILKTNFTSSNSPAWAAATATKEGVIVLWNITTGDSLHILDDIFSPISKIRLFSNPAKFCTRCGNLKGDAMVLCFAVEDQCIVYNMEIDQGSTENLSVPRCTCTLVGSSLGLDAPIAGKRSRSGSSTTGTPNRLKQKGHNPSFSNGDSIAPFPVSAHGVHTRRTTSESQGRLALDINQGSGIADKVGKLTVEDLRDWTRISPLATLAGSMLGRPLCTRMAVVRVNRGQWDLHVNHLVGIRRREMNLTPGDLATRVRQQTSSATHEQQKQNRSLVLPVSVLNKWEMLTLDLSNLNSLAFDALESSGIENTALRISSLHDLYQRRSGPNDQDDDKVRQKEVKDDYPRLPYTRISCFEVGQDVAIAGLGNTLGVVHFR